MPFTTLYLLQLEVAIVRDDIKFPSEKGRKEKKTFIMLYSGMEPKYPFPIFSAVKIIILK